MSAALTHLTYWVYSNHSLAAGVLPAALTRLTYGYVFNQALTADV